MRTMKAKFPGICRQCGLKFGPGTPILYGGRGRTYHAGLPGDDRPGCAPDATDWIDVDRMAEDSMAEACGLGGFGERD